MSYISYTRTILLFVLVLAIIGCRPIKTPPPDCGAGIGKSQAIELSKAVQGAGAVFYKTFYNVLDPSSNCPGGTVTGLKANSSSYLTIGNAKINFILTHKVPQNMTVEQIAQDPNLYIALDPDQAMTKEQLKDLFEGDLQFPIDKPIQAFVSYNTPPNPLPSQIYVQLDWVQ
ncbi:MAG: hypothetical protein AB1489_14355 [Acidobacteriota bacterium]